MPTDPVEPESEKRARAREAAGSLPPTRRAVLAAAGVATASAVLNGCIVQPFPFPKQCPVTPPPPPENDWPLTVDAHCHIFNGTDLQVKLFLTKVEFPAGGVEGDALKIAADLLQDAAWDEAPSGKEELKLLKELAACKDGQLLMSNLEQHRETGYTRAQRAIRKGKKLSSYQKSKGRGPAAGVTSPPPPPPPPGSVNRPSEADVANQILNRLKATSWQEFRHAVPAVQSVPPAPVTSTQSLPQNPAGTPVPAPAPQPSQQNGQPTSAADCPTIQLPITVACPGTARTVDGLTEYVAQNFQYRYVMIQDYCDTFFQKPGRNVDLMVTSLVDYDWWLALGKKTKTSLQDQVLVMEQISIVTRGQVHALVPFDPLREVAFLAGKGSKYSSLQLVQDAIENRGCIGVKLYPPMGFAPYGNASLDQNIWNDSGLPSWMPGDITYTKDKSTAKIGRRLDDALASLYTWCLANDVPLMAHTSESNGSKAAFMELAGAAHWACALNNFKGLRISFGHFGDFSDTLCSTPLQANQFAGLMSDTKGSPGEHAFADAGYYSEIDADADAELLEERMRTFYQQPVSEGHAALARRFMYGTDWNLLISQGNIDSYFERFVTVLNNIDKVVPAIDGFTASQRFFGYNAIDWLGLRSGPARDRLTAFYQKNGVSQQPAWMRKVPAAGRT
jgi:hypothetical protein